LSIFGFRGLTVFLIEYLAVIFLAQKPTAIVSPIAGTTRDVIESTIDLGGYPIVICDTAGLRITDDPIENEGVLRAVDRLVDSEQRRIFNEA
ncbi:unnamed protein product, partial [Rotaria magnacalcarata]